MRLSRAYINCTSRQRLAKVKFWPGVSMVVVATIILPQTSVFAILQEDPSDSIMLSGVIRDFAPDHPDFAISDPITMGHYVRNVSPTLDSTRRPVFTNSGEEVVSQWYDKDGNPIAPYAGPGLPGGHFDVDVYDKEPSTKKVFHEHEYDDKNDITYVDIVNNPWLEGKDFATLVGNNYPNNLRLEFLNVHNGGGGIYTFEAGGPVETGYTADGFTIIFDPALFTLLRINFVSLADLRATKPKDSQSDAVDRDDSFHLRMYDVVTDEMVYEFAVYHHFNANEPPVELPVGTDACGVDIDDIAGAYGSAGSGGISDTESFDQWFRDELGTNQSAGQSIELQRDPDGVYEYMTDNFFPIDGMMQGNGDDSQNNYFTYTFAATFTYNQCTSQFFEFESNDDAWVYIDDKLVIDLGGVSTPSKQYVAMDRLNLVDGQEYTLNFFFAHRRDSMNSTFNLRTNLVLSTGELPSITGFFD